MTSRHVVDGEKTRERFRLSSGPRRHTDILLSVGYCQLVATVKASSDSELVVLTEVAIIHGSSRATIR